MKILHIHTDPKFVYDSNFFDFDDYHNEIVFLYTKKTIQVNSIFPVVNVKNNIFALPRIKRICKNYDVVVVYDLETFKIALVNSLKKDIKIIWRFFGHEIYGRHKDLYCSNLTLNCVSEKLPSFFKRIHLSFNYRFRFIFDNYIFGNNKGFLSAIERINYFYGLFEEEYDEVKKIYNNLPPFIKVPLFSKKISFSIDKLEGKLENKIIIGNSRNTFNNHLDIIEIVKTYSGYNYIMPFSYGYESTYSDTVRTKAIKIGVTIQETFLKFEEYTNMLNESSCLIINSYRQMAMGNIILAIEYGMKIYLNKKNIVYHVLVDNGFIISEIMELENDLNQQNITLSMDEMKQNIDRYNTMSDLYKLADFKDAIDHL